MRPRSHFPWGRWISVLLLLMILMPITQHAFAAQQQMSGPSGDTVGPVQGQGNGGGPGGDGGKDTPTSQDGDPDDYGRILQLLSRLIFVLIY